MAQGVQVSVLLFQGVVVVITIAVATTATVILIVNNMLLVLPNHSRSATCIRSGHVFIKCYSIQSCGIFILFVCVCGCICVCA